MENKREQKKGKRSYRLAAVMSILIVFMTLMVYAFSESPVFEKVDKGEPTYGHLVQERDRLKSVQAFAKVYAVLQSPRCLNCHPAGDVPFQGDEKKLHAIYPQRGKDGKGILTMKCTNCHQHENTSGPHTPPGSPNWHLPPADMKMVFEGKSPHELAKQLIDPAKNGHKDIDALIAHADDSLVLWGWDPGEGRTLPPISHKEFKEAWITWLKTGSYAPTE